MDVYLSAFKSAAWTATLPFKGHLCSPSDDFSASLEMKHDLFDYTTSLLYKGPIKYIIRFSPLLYPIDGGFGKDGGGGKQLLTDLCQAARSHGHCALASNGSSGRDCKHQRVLQCSYARKYQPHRPTQLVPESYRVSTYIGDKKNARGSNSSGKAMPRRASTRRPAGCCTCSVRIVLQVDHFSFHLVCGRGDKNHMGHPQMSPNEIVNRKRFLDNGNLDNVAVMAAANIEPAKAASLTRSRTGQVFTRGQMAYIQGFSRMAQNLMDSEHHGTLRIDTSPSDNMLNYLRRIGASFVCLYHHGRTKEVRAQTGKAARTEGNHVCDHDQLTSIFVTSDDTSAVERNVSLESAESADVKDYAQKSRHAVGASDDQDILIACCWVLPNGRRLFKAFPEVIGVDGTHETNNESRPLLTLSVKDSDGNVIVVLRCFAPNERSWLFRWLFQEALPVLLGKDTLELVKLIMTDGDSQEMTQVDYAIDTFLSMQFVPDVGGTLFIKAGDENVEAWVFGKARKQQPKLSGK